MSFQRLVKVAKVGRDFSECCRGASQVFFCFGSQLLDDLIEGGWLRASQEAGINRRLCGDNLNFRIRRPRATTNFRYCRIAAQRPVNCN
jgi:hypothetical protein